MAAMASRPLSFANLAPALLILAGAFLAGCPPKIPLDERLPPPPPLARGNVDDGPIARVKRPSRLTADPTQEYDPAPAPDGQVIAYVSHHSGNADIFLRFLPGSGRVGEYPIVAHYAADTDPAWSPNGRQIAFVSRRDDPKGDLYLYNVKTGDAVPDAIRDAVLQKFGDAMASPDTGRTPAEIEQLSRVSEFLEKRDPVIRLSDAEREDRGPAWSPDGHFLYYAARMPGEPENVWVMDLRKFDAKQLTTDGGFDPAPSPNGKYLAYTARVGSGARLRVRRFEDGAVLDVTRGEALDGFPAWSRDAKSLFFVRYAYDTNEDGKVDVRDRPQIWQIPFDADASFAAPNQYVERRPWPVTPSGAYDLFPHVAGGKIFYSSDDGTNSDVYSIPEAGIFPPLPSGDEDLSLADSLSAEPALRLLLLDQVAARRTPESAAAQDATIAAARLRSDRRELSAARTQIEALLADRRVTGPRRARAQVLRARIAALVAAKSGPGGTADKTALRRTADELEKLSGGFALEGAGAAITAMKGAKAEALLEAGNARAEAGDLLPATEDWQRAVKDGEGWPRSEAWLEAARAYAGLGQADRSVATFVAALKEYPDLIVPAERRAAAERERATMVSRIDAAIAAASAAAPHAKGIDLAQLPDVGVPETYGERAAEGVAAAAILGAQDARSGAVDPSAAIAALRDLASRYRDLPVLPSLAHNEIGDLYVRLGDLQSASMEFASVSAGNADPRQAQRARLSAAKALLVEGRYEEAVKALGDPPPPEIPAGPKGVLARRARKAYVKTLLARADEEFRGHDYALARKSYRAVLAADAREVRAHRGLIACYAALGEADRVSKIYEDEADKTPDDPLIRYGVGLSWSYRAPEEKWMPRAEEELKKAVFLDDSQVFPHQTLGFVFEKEEELLGEKNGFERAADQYLLALSLNDANEDFRNAADLELNVGNAFFGLENHRRAYDYYARREKRDVPFDVKGRELVYRERFARCAFESNRFEEAVKRYDAALAFLDTLTDKDLPATSRAEHRAHLLDERAWTLDQSQRAPSEAAAAYLDAAKANSLAGNEQNSAKSLRNAAIQLFEKGTGESDYGATLGTAGVMVDKAALVDALDYLGESLEGVEKRGALLHKAAPKKRHGLFHYNMSMSLSTDASTAVEGFDTKGEKELIYTFLGRIYESLDDAQRARDYYEKKKALLPSKVAAWQQQSLDYKRALLDNQIGVLAWETGDVPAAWSSLEASYKRAISIGDIPGAMTNAANLALIAVDLHDADRREKALSLLDEAISLLDHTGTPDPERYTEALHGARAELLLQKAATIAPAKSADPAGAAKAVTGALATQTKLLKDAEKDELTARNAIDGSLKGFPGQNRARVAVTRGLARIAVLTGRTDDATRRYAEASKAAVDHGMPGLAAQVSAESAALLGKDDAAIDAALKSLEAVPGPVLARELDARGVEPYYRRLAASALAKGDAPAAMTAMERLRAVQLVALADGTIPLAKGGDVEGAAKKVAAARAEVVRSWKIFTSWNGPASGEGWRSRKELFDKAVAAWSSAVEEWGNWDEPAWALAHPSTFYPDSLFSALPADGAFVYFVAEPDALWVLACSAGKCAASKAGPSPALDPAGAKAAAAKTVVAAASAAGKSSRVQVVPDVGLYDASWMPADLRAGRVVAIQRSAQMVVASFARRGPYRERPDVASTAGAANFLAAAPRADVLRLDVPGTIPAGEPLEARWEVSAPDGPPPVRRILARDVVESGTKAALVVADVTKGADPETLLALADVWIHAGTGAVLFVDPTDYATGDVAAKSDLAGAKGLLAGHPGMNAAELKAFGDEQLQQNLESGAAANEEKRWDDAMLAFDRADYLIDALKIPDAPKAKVLQAQSVAAFNAAEWTRGARYASELVAALDAQGEKGEPLADALVLLGVLQQRAEQYDAAAATLARGAERYESLGKREGKARSLTNLGATFESALLADKAIASYRDAMAVNEDLGATAKVGDLERKIGRVYYQRLEDYAQAEAHFAAARAAYAKAKDPVGDDEARLEIGLVAERRGALTESKKAYQEVYDRAVARKDKAIQAKAELYLANTAWLSADYQTAFTHVRNVRHAADDLKDKRLAFLSRSTEGLVDWTLNDLPRATALQNEALEMARGLGTPIDEASTWNNLGIIYRSAGDYDKAVDSFEHAIEIDKKLGSKWGQAYDLRNLGLTWLLSNAPERAEGPLEEAVNLSAQIGDKVNGTKALLALADFHRLRGNRDQARGFYQRALDGALDVHLPEVTWRAHRGLGDLARESGDAEKARAEIDAALAVVEELRAAIKVEELKNGFIADKLDLYDDAIQLALDNPPAGADKALLAWNYSERSRARSFIDLLANRRITLSSADDNRRIDEQRALKDKIFAAEDALVKAPADQKPAKKAALDALREQYRDLLVEIRAANPKLSAFVTVDPPTLEDVRKVLGKDSALVEYHVAARETIVWTITDTTIRVTRLPIGRAQMQKNVKDYLGDLEAVRPVDERERALGKAILEPALGPEVAGKRYLGIIPHGPLHYVPFAALRTGDDYLIDKWSLFYVPSAAVIPLEIGVTPSVAPGSPKEMSKVLAIGNPDLGDPSFSLPFADLEVGDLKLDFPQIDVLTHERATDRWVAANIGKYRVIHFAAHGEFDPVNPLFSAIRLAHDPADAAGGNGALTAHDIFGIPMRAELVTLSACQTGISKIEGGDELIGLNRAFLYAGTRSVMSTLWRVHDGSTAVLIKHFYRNYTRESKADALRDSMRSVREYYPHPAYWAAFALTGEYR